MAEMESSVSISITSAIVYVVSGLVFFFLVFVLVMMGVTNCNWHCEGGSVQFELVRVPNLYFGSNIYNTVGEPD